MNRRIDAVDPGPWYREPWPWIVMAGPLVVVIAAIVTAWIAFAGADGLVADDYYKRGLAINKELKRSAAAIAAGVRGKMAYDAATQRIRLVLDRPALAAEDEVTLLLAHPTRAAEDRRMVLARGPDGAYHGAVALPAAGRWRVVLETAQWRLEGDWRDPGRPLALGSTEEGNVR